MTDECHGEDPPKNRTRQRTMMMPWWCVAMIINAFERQQEIKELYQDDAYTIHIIHEQIITVGSCTTLDDFEGCNLQKPFGKPQRH